MFFMRLFEHYTEDTETYWKILINNKLFMSLVNQIPIGCTLILLDLVESSIMNQGLRVRPPGK